MQTVEFNPADADRHSVEQSLGRKPEGLFKVVVRDKSGLNPIVIMNYPILKSGRPMPTLFWLVGLSEVKLVSQIESKFGLKAVEVLFKADDIVRIHESYSKTRSELIPDDYIGIKPSGGVGGTSKGLKCLHAHLANYLATEADPVGQWTFNQCNLSTDDYIRV